jgi:hypothetical protein
MKRMLTALGLLVALARPALCCRLAASTRPSSAARGPSYPCTSRRRLCKATV